MPVEPTASLSPVVALRLLDVPLLDGLPQPVNRHKATHKGIHHRLPARIHRTSLCKLLTPTLSRIISKAHAAVKFCDT